MKKFVCDLCGYIYDEAAGAPTRASPPAPCGSMCPRALSAPLCGADKSQFSEA